MREHRWFWWWVIGWGTCTVVLLALAAFLPFHDWLLATTIGFGGMEVIGLIKGGDRYPPLTYVIRQYLPQWYAMTVIYAVWGCLAWYWMGGTRPLRFGLLFGLLGWLSAHFAPTSYQLGEGEQPW